MKSRTPRSKKDSANETAISGERSRRGFGVRFEEFTGGVDCCGGLGDASGESSSSERSRLRSGVIPDSHAFEKTKRGTKSSARSSRAERISILPPRFTRKIQPHSSGRSLSKKQ
jgi:hypothetical protein